MQLDSTGKKGHPMVNRRSFAKHIAGVLPVYATIMAREAQAQQAPAPPAGRGGQGAPEAGRQYPPGRGPFDGSPVGDPLPGQKWKVHDHARPQPRKVTPGQPIPTMSAPSDAIVLFDGKDLSKWSAGGGRGAPAGAAPAEPQWKIVDGHAEMRGGIVTKESFGDIQLHVEWTTPPVDDQMRVGQQRGNSGVVFMGRYEVQVLSGYENITYADGGVASIYGVYPPMVNPCLPEGQWNSFDFVFEAPKFEADKLVKPAFLTLFFNGVMVHNRAQFLGATAREPLATYTPHAAELPFQLQGHVGPAWYRNIWVRRIVGYDA
ncbi:MAG: DUF1080 domain-containing protein [Candidatus Solibacter sp.]